MTKCLLRTIAILTAACGLLLAADADSPSAELAGLKALVAQQQAQIDQLREMLQQQGKLLEVVAAREAVLAPVQVASASPVVPSARTPDPLPAAVPAPQANALADRVDALSKTIGTLSDNLGGFKFSGDFRYRLDLQLRSSNQFAGPLQNTRGRYRLRLNLDKQLAAGLSAHAQLSTGPLSNEITNDQDFAALGVKNTFGISEAWLRYTKGRFSIRGGRMEEVFADNQRFLWDDDLRLNGFDARYEIPFSDRAGLELRAGEYILTNPNIQVLPATSPYVAAGYQPGQKVRDATLFHPGFIFHTRTGAWTQQIYGDYSWYRHADQIQLASTAAGVGSVVNGAIGLTLASPIGGSGNATTTPGGVILAAPRFQIARLGYRADLGSFRVGGRNMPFWTDFQGGINTGTDADRNAYMLSFNLGATRQRGDLRFLYQYGYKQANSLVSQFTDDDLGTGSGVNIRVNAMRVDVGLTRFLQWQNILFIQDPISGNGPDFFVKIPRGANTTFRYLGQLAFAF